MTACSLLVHAEEQGRSGEWAFRVAALQQRPLAAVPAALVSEGQAATPREPLLCPRRRRGSLLDASCDHRDVLVGQQVKARAFISLGPSHCTALLRTAPLRTAPHCQGCCHHGVLCLSLLCGVHHSSGSLARR